MQRVQINNELYMVKDALNNITLADSFLLNKTGTGNGEAKMYVGYEQDEELQDFFKDFTNEKNGFFLKKDFLKMLDDLKEEYLYPQNTYYSKKTIKGKKEIIDVTTRLPSKWNELNKEISTSNEILPFKFYKSLIEPPRMYINAQSENYKMLRNIGIPNISYISILKLENENEEVFYYFKPFVSYSNEIQGYEYLTYKESKEIEEIESSSLSEKTKVNLKTARIGQGKYRENLFEEIPFCPFTKINDERLLIASHIKPWVVSSNEEKIDPKNGITLSPTYDVLFDRGFISFENDGSLLVSPFISPMNQKRLDIKEGKKIQVALFLDDKRTGYLEYHRQNIFKGV